MLGRGTGVDGTESGGGRRVLIERSEDASKRKNANSADKRWGLSERSAAERGWNRAERDGAGQGVIKNCLAVRLAAMGEGGSAGIGVEAVVCAGR